MKQIHALQKAEKLFKARKFSTLVRFLQPLVFTYRENPRFYYLLGSSCARLNDIASAYSYLMRSLQIEPESNRTRLALAAIHLKRGEVDDCLRLWLAVLEEEPGNGLAKKGLELLKKNADREKLPAVIDQLRIHVLMPSPGFWVPGSIRLILGGTLAILLGFFSLQALLPVIIPPVPPRSGSVEFNTGGEVLSDLTSEPVIEYSREQLEKALEELGLLFNEHKDNQVRFQINSIQYSNATRAIKNRAAQLLPHLREPTFTTLDKSWSLTEVRERPQLFNRVFVRWKGRVSNVVVGENRITFDFLVGYTDNRVLEGIIPAYSEFAARFDTSFAYDLLGEVILDRQNRPSFRVVSVHEIAP